MDLPVLASPQDLADRYPGLGEPSELLGPLAAASALARAYTKRPTGWVDENGELTEVPDAVFEAVLLIARRVALMPTVEATEETAGPFSVKRDSSMWLSTAEKILLDTAMNTSGAVTSMTVQGPVPPMPLETYYVPVGDGSTDPVAWE